MGRPKSFLSTLIVDYAKVSHNCRFNKQHRIKKDGKRLTAKEGRATLRYCPACAIQFLKLDKATIQTTIASLEVLENSSNSA
jgi:hypothetical protein